MDKILAIIPVIVAFNVVLAAVSALASKISEILGSPGAGKIASALSKVSALIAKALDVVGYNPKH
jgi:hypothetical protein